MKEEEQEEEEKEEEEGIDEVARVEEQIEVKKWFKRCLVEGEWADY